MNDEGDLKDDVRMPEGEIGDKITKFFKTDEKDTSKFTSCSGVASCELAHSLETDFLPRRCCPHFHG